MKKFFSIISNAINSISKEIATIGITLGVALAFANVVARYGFDYSFTWAAELTVYFFLWGMFFGVVYCFKIDKHITINFLVTAVNKKIAKILLLTTGTITTVFLSIVSFYGYKYLLFVVELDERSVDLDVAMWIPYLVIPVSFAFSAYVVGEHLIKLIKTPSKDLIVTNESEDIFKELATDDILKQANQKSGGLL